MSYLFTSESVSEGHPDKVADQISDTILDQLLAYDSTARVAVETLVTTGQVVIAGEVHSDAYVDLQTLARKAWKCTIDKNTAIYNSNVASADDSIRLQKYEK